MTREAMLTELKAVLKESAVDAAWGNTRLLEFLAEAQDQFCDDTGYFVDKRTYTITTVADQAAYAISDRVIAVKEVWDGDRKLGKFVQNDRDPYDRIWVAVTFPSSTGAEAHAWQADQETGYITLYPTPPDAGVEYTLRVWRRSLEWLSDAGAEPEVPVQFHRGLIQFAAYIALTDHDFETQDKVSADKHFKNYTYYMRKGITAVNRVLNKPTDAEPNPSYTVRA